MEKISGLTIISDRGGHLHNALKLVEQLGRGPEHLLITWGPEFDGVKSLANHVFRIPYLFSWFGKVRWLNPFKIIVALLYSFFLALFLRPKHVISLGATNVVFFCYWAKLFGAKIIHVECMNQVATRSMTGRVLYPIADKIFVQWKGLEEQYGPKAEYAGWVL